MVTIIVWSDDPLVVNELAGKAASFGTVKAFDDSTLPDKDSATVAVGLATVAKEANADLVLVGATKKGRDVGPRLSAHLDWPFAAEALAIDVPGNWTVERMVLSGNSKATYTMGPKAVVTVTPKTFEAGASPSERLNASGIAASRVKVVG